MEAPALTLHLRYREKSDSGITGPLTRTAQWDSHKTAIVVCDVWDTHWCQSAAARVDELAPVMNEMLRQARAQGVFILHAPSDTMDFYQDTVQRQRAMEAPVAPPPASGDLRSWHRLDPTREPPLPIDNSDAGCEDDPRCPTGNVWTRQHPVLEIAPEDAISDRGDEVYNLLKDRGIENVIVMGVHTNMCVLGRPFSIRRLVTLGWNVALMRDMTDSLYNPRMAPFVSHFQGTNLVVEHVETYWCPTLVSTDLTGRPAFRFQADDGN